MDDAAFRATARADAGLFTHIVVYPVAARLARIAHARGVRPTALTLGGLVLGVGASVAVILAEPNLVTGPIAALNAAAETNAGLDAVAGPSAALNTAAETNAGPSSGLNVLVGVLAWLGWQLAYCLDCADGQLARVTGTASAAGARLDVLCDVAVQIALVAAVITVSDGYPAWLSGVFAGGWMVGMVTSVMAREGTNVSLTRSRALPVRLVKVVRDHGFKVTVIAAVLVVSPPAMVWVMWFYAVLNTGFLLASIAHMSWAGRPRPAGRTGAGRGGEGQRIRNESRSVAADEPPTATS